VDCIGAIAILAWWLADWIMILTGDLVQSNGTPLFDDM